MVGYAKTNNMHTVILIMCLKEDFDEEETSANTRKNPGVSPLKDTFLGKPQERV